MLVEEHIMSSYRSLKDILLMGGLTYSSQWGIYAQKIDGMFKEESLARFGQRIFENGGLLDDCCYFGNNESIVDSRDNYCGCDDDDASYFYEEWVSSYIDEVNNE
jgi:hypothetical protein